MPMDECNLTFVNVGYGEAVVLRCPAPERPGGWFVMVIDGGSGEAEEYADRASGRLTLAEYLAAAGVDHIDCMVATHIHEDHVCGLLPAAERWRPAELWQTLPPAFYREAMHLLDTSPAKTASQSKFLRALNDYQRLCGLVEAGGGAIRRFSAGDSGVLCSGLRYQVLAPGVERAGALEARAKEEPNKDAIALFDPQQEHTYSWTRFGQKVLGEKLALLCSFFNNEKQTSRGKAFLYRLLELLRRAQEENSRLQLARYAYLLSRLEPAPSAPDHAAYRHFADAMYQWALDSEERRALITAIYIYVYEIRKGETE